MNIVAVPFHDWKKSQVEGFRTRDAHLLKEFSQHGSVRRLLIVDRPISIAEMAVLRRPWRIRRGNLVYRRGRSCLTQADTNTFVLDILAVQVMRPLLQRHRWLPYIYSKSLVGKAVTDALRYLRMEGYVFFASSPLALPLYQQ